MPTLPYPTGQYIPTGNPDTMNVQINQAPSVPGQFNPYAGGQLGMSFNSGDRTYTLVQLDSGATSATPTGAVAANQLLFWKDKSARIVTNDKRFALASGNGASNFVAGVARGAFTPGTYGSVIAMLVKGHNIPVASSGSGSAGDTAIADTTASVARVANVAAGTASTYRPVGIMRGAAGATVNVDVDIPTL